MEEKGVTQNGQPSAAAILAAVNMNIEIDNPKVTSILAGSITAWDKVKVTSWAGDDLKTSSGKHFGVHFYKRLDGAIDTSEDYHIVFTDPIP